MLDFFFVQRRMSPSCVEFSFKYVTCAQRSLLSRCFAHFGVSFQSGKSFFPCFPRCIQEAWPRLVFKAFIEYRVLDKTVERCINLYLTTPNFKQWSRWSVVTWGRAEEYLFSTKLESPLLSSESRVESVFIRMMQIKGIKFGQLRDCHKRLSMERAFTDGLSLLHLSCKWKGTGKWCHKRL